MNEISKGEERIAALQASAKIQMEELFGPRMTLDELRSVLGEGCLEQISDGQLCSLRHERGLRRQAQAMSLLLGNELPKEVEDLLGFEAQLTHHEWELLDEEYERRKPPLEEQIADLEGKLLRLDEALEEKLEATRTQYVEKRAQLEAECAHLKEKENEDAENRS